MTTSQSCDTKIAAIAAWIYKTYGETERKTLVADVATEAARERAAAVIYGRYASEINNSPSKLKELLAELAQLPDRNHKEAVDRVRRTHLSAIREALAELSRTKLASAVQAHLAKTAAKETKTRVSAYGREMAIA